MVGDVVEKPAEDLVVAHLVKRRHRVDNCHRCNIYVHVGVVECSYFAEDVTRCHGKSTPGKHEGDLP